MTHILKHSLEIWDSFWIVILTPNDKSLRLAIYAFIISVTFNILGSTLAQKLQNLLHVLQLLVIVIIVIPLCTIFRTGTLTDCSGYKIVQNCKKWVQNCLVRMWSVSFSRSKPPLNFFFGHYWNNACVLNSVPSLLKPWFFTNLHISL